ncbi:hypothetical protein F5Y15DRAFT_377689 [Xylariaceae sp. FL0016]|nr:hypothetical protein F5Y15DRAFT_377689 [Xylariaceae sp. FL0016]
MASAEPQSDHGTAHGRFDNALFDFATTFVKKELQQLARERDDNLARNHVPKLRGLLRQVDSERDAFDQDKERLIRGYREKLGLLQIDAKTVETAVADLNGLSSKYLSVIPTASTLTIRPPTPLMSPLQNSNYFTTVLGANVIPDKPMSAPPLVNPPPQNPSPDQQSPLQDSCISPRRTTLIDHQVQTQTAAGNSKAVPSSKRTRLEGRHQGSKSSKRHKGADGRKKALGKTQADVSRKIAFPNLETGESIFLHSERRGYFVIRCDRPGCATIFTEAPLVYNRALKHFGKHGEAGLDGGDLTNEYIFDKFACQVEGTELASKYWIREHLGTTPHTFVPGKARRNTLGHLELQRMEQKNQESDSKLTSPTKDEEVRRSNDPDDEMDEKPRRTPRSVPRPDYAELIANKDPWNTSDSDSERTSKTTKTSRACSSSHCKSSKPSTISPTNASKPMFPNLKTGRIPGGTEPNKPFGYTSEQWPRRSAPR